MRKEQITDKEGTYLVAIFIMGSTLILGIGGEAGNAAWIAAVVGLLMVVPMILIYSRLLFLFHGKDLFEILESILGRMLGKMIALLFVWYAFHLGALVIRNFGEFINTVSMPETPILVPMLFLGISCIANARSGVEVIGRMSTYLLPIVVVIIVLVQILAIPQLEMDNLRPILEQGITPVLQGGFAAFTFPFAESILFMGVFNSLKNKKTIFKVYSFGILFAGTIIVMLTIRNIVVLGDLREKLYFPSHVAVSRIAIGNFIQRMEVTVAFVFIVGAFVKSSVCLYVSSKGIAKIFNLHNYRSVVIQLGLLMIYFSYIVFDSIMDMKPWAFKVYPYYALPFQVILPIIIWIIAEIKNKKSVKRGKTIN